MPKLQHFPSAKNKTKPSNQSKSFQVFLVLYIIENANQKREKRSKCVRPHRGIHWFLPPMLRPSRSPVRQCCCAPGATTTGAYFGEERRNAPDPVARPCDVTNDHCRAVSRPRAVSPQRNLLLLDMLIYLSIYSSNCLWFCEKKRLKQWERQSVRGGEGGRSSDSSNLQDQVYNII